MPRDNDSTMLLELRHISESEEKEPAWWIDRGQMLPAQLPVSDDPREQQLQPGDYEAQVTQRPIAIHGMEHLGATDRGITMFRRQIRRGIRAVRNNEELRSHAQLEGEHFPTYCNDTVVYAPPAPTPEEDEKLMRETGRRLAEEYVATRNNGK